MDATAADRYRWVLIDQFQDTDPSRSSSPRCSSTVDALGARPPMVGHRIATGALTLVGDPKQSIYRFRDGDLRVYDEATDLSTSMVSLVENFRSASAYFDVVNTVFEEAADRAPGVQPPHVTLHAHRTPRRARAGWG